MYYNMDNYITNIYLNIYLGIKKYEKNKLAKPAAAKHQTKQQQKTTTVML